MKATDRPARRWIGAPHPNSVLARASREEKRKIHQARAKYLADQRAYTKGMRKMGTSVTSWDF